jgi:hypothetical protein
MREGGKKGGGRGKPLIREDKDRTGSEENFRKPGEGGGVPNWKLGEKVERRQRRQEEEASNRFPVFRSCVS